jgi:tetratricopeptide (TPR) repeat protein
MAAGAGESRLQGTSAARWMPWALVAVVIVVFGAVVTHEFAPLDDQGTIWANKRLNPPHFDSQGVLWYWRHAELSLYIPVTYTIWGLLAKATWVPTPDEQGIAVDPHVYHAASLFVHALSVLAVYAILRRLLARQPNAAGGDPTWPAALAAALYALHPLQVEAVAWASGLKDLLYGCLSLTAIYLYLASVSRPASRAPRQALSHPRALQALGIACMILGMLCKPTAMVTPLIVVVLDRLILRRPWRQVAADAWPWFVAIIPLAIVAKAVQPPGSLLRPLAWHERFEVAGASLAFYLGKLVAPTRLAIDYGWRPQWMLTRPWFHWLWIVPAALAALLWATRKRWPWPATAALVSLAALLPVLGLVPFQYQFYSTVADHYAYLAMLGSAIFAGWLLTRLPAAKPIAAVVLIVLAALSWTELRHWRTPQALIAREMQVVPDSLLGHNALGFLYWGRHDDDLAEREFRRALEIDPEYQGARNNLKSYYVEHARPREAIEQVEALISLNPKLPAEFQGDQSHALLEAAVQAALAHRFDDAVQYLQAYLKYHPEDAQATVLLGKCRDARNKTAATKPTP